MSKKTQANKAKRKKYDSSILEEFLQNKSFLYKFLSRYFSEKQDIEDVTQETFLRAFIAEQQKQIDQPKPYLFHIAKNLAFTKLNKQSKQLEYLIEAASEGIENDESNTIENELEALESLGIYCEAVAALPERCRQVFLLRKVHGLTHKQIAHRMSLSISSIEKYLLKGMLDCQAYFEKKEVSLMDRHQRNKSQKDQRLDRK